MGSVAQAVLDFDEAVQVPWRPPLVSAPSLTVLPGGAAAAPGRAYAARAARQAGPSEAPPVRRTRPGSGRTRARSGCSRCGSAGACVPAPLRLTRRARRLLAAVLAGAVVAVATWMGALAHDDGALQLVGDTSTVVRAGDTLWSIARSVAGDADVRVVVDDIQRLNGLDDADLAPGQVLQLP